MVTPLFSMKDDLTQYICPFEDGGCSGSKCEGLIHLSSSKTNTDAPCNMSTPFPPYLWCVLNSYLQEVDSILPFTTVVAMTRGLNGEEVTFDQMVLSYDYGREVEKEYSDPDYSNCIIADDDARIEIDFQKELMTNKDSGEVFEIKRLGTPSPLLFRNAPNTTGWVWYWQSDDPERNWSELNYFRVSEDDDYWSCGTVEKAYLAKDSRRIKIDVRGHDCLLPFSVNASQKTMFDRAGEQYDLRRRPAIFSTFVEWCYLDNPTNTPSVMLTRTGTFAGPQWVTFGDLNAYGDTRFPVTSEMLEKMNMTKQFMLDCGTCNVNLAKKEICWTDGPTWKTQDVTVPVRRDVFTGRQLIPFDEFPKTWDPMPKSRIYITATVPPNTPEHNLVKSLIRKTVPNNDISLIRRIQNPATYKSYLESKNAIATLYPNHELREEWLFHGTSDIRINQICERNFDPSLAGSAHGTAYGHGTYFARDASLSMGYAGAGRGYHRSFPFSTSTTPAESLPERKKMKLLVCKVLVGPKQVGGHGVPGQRFQTLVDHVNSTSIFVNAEPHSFRPEYIVEL